MRLKDIAIFGVGGFGREVLALIKDINKVTPTYIIVGFFDDGLLLSRKNGSKVL